MRTRLHLLLLLTMSSLIGAVTSLVAVTATTQTADACSIAPPYAEVRPSSNLIPGQRIELQGWGFTTVVPGDGIVPPDQNDAVRASEVAPCDIKIEPMLDIAIIWQANEPVKLGVVDGPEFTVALTVPAGTTHGWAAIDVGGYWIEVDVGPIVDPPPCPLAAAHEPATSPQGCSDPWPCPLATNVDNNSPNWLPYCPDPCPLVGDVGVGLVLPPECPDPWPCSIAASPHECPDPCPYAGDVGVGLVLPPECPDPWPCSIAASPHECPDPCPYAGDVGVGLVLPPECPDPWPCPVAATGGGAPSVFPCPDPCPLVLAEGVLSPPECPDPWPCPIAAREAGDQTPGSLPYCPEPCLDHAHLDPNDTPDRNRWECPPPCETHRADPGEADAVPGNAVWCPPECPVHVVVPGADVVLPAWVS